MKRGNKSLGFSFGMSLMAFGVFYSSTLWGNVPTQLKKMSIRSSTQEKTTVDGKTHKNLLPFLVELHESIFSYLSFDQLVDIYSSNKINDSDKFEIGRVFLKMALGLSLG